MEVMGKGSVRRRELANERATKRRPDDWEMFERHSKPPSKRVRENKSEESTKVYNYSTEIPLNTTAGVLDSEIVPRQNTIWKTISTQNSESFRDHIGFTYN